MSILPDKIKRAEPEGGKVQLKLPFLKQMKEDRSKTSEITEIESNKENNNIEEKKNESTPKKIGFLTKWETSYVWVRHNPNSNLMFCTWCEDYAAEEKLILISSVFPYKLPKKNRPPEVRQKPKVFASKISGSAGKTDTFFNTDDVI